MGSIPVTGTIYPSDGMVDMLVLETNALSVGVQVSPGVPKVPFICVKVIDKLDKISYNIIVKVKKKIKQKTC